MQEFPRIALPLLPYPPAPLMAHHPRFRALFAPTHWQSKRRLQWPQQERVWTVLPAIWLLVGMLVASMLLYGFAPQSAMGQTPPLSRVFEAMPLQGRLAKVVDGDTLDVDLDGNGTFETPQERIRLLYVDTPEPNPSHKGQDVERAEQATDFLRNALGLSGQPTPLPAGVVLHVDPLNATGNYGRTLAMLYLQDTNLNLELIRQGLGLFDARYSLPAPLGHYLLAEQHAFEARMGIWNTPESTQRYLERLRQEGRTVVSPQNPLVAPSTITPAQLADHVGRFVTLQAQLLRVEPRSRGVMLYFLQGPNGTEVEAVLFPRQAGKLEHHPTRYPWPTFWQSGASLIVQGFASLYRGRVQLVIHNGEALIPQP